MSVLGPLAATDLGVTLTHEHVFIDASVWFVTPEPASRRRHLNAPITMEMLSELRRRPFSVTRQNMILEDEAQIAAELTRFRDRGGTTLVEVTPIGMGRDPLGLQRLARATGINIIASTGIYVESAHPDWAWGMDAEQISHVFIRELQDGIDDTGVRCGLIGEIGLSGIPRGAGRRKVGAITEEEEKVLRAAGQASQHTGAPVTIHLDPIPPRAGLEAIRILTEEGVQSDNIIIGHLDQVQDLDYHRQIAETGVFLEYDSLGRDHYSQEWGAAFDWGHDSWRIRYISALINEGCGDQLLLSQDVCLKTDLTAFEGPGYGHILENIVPSLVALGISRDDIDKLLVANPARALSPVRITGQAPPAEFTATSVLQADE